MKGYTRASALGPISDFVEAQGGSIERVFRRVDLPLAILDNPNLPLPLSEQFNVLGQSGREVGDPFFGASLGRLVSMEKLSAFGAWVTDAPTLASAIDRSQRGLNLFLQTATNLKFRVKGKRATWSIEFLDAGDDGRFQNELLGVSYLIDGVRQFVGKEWSPAIIRSTCIGARQANALEKVFRAPVLQGFCVSSIEFDAALLAVAGRRASPATFASEPSIPPPLGLREEVAALSSIALLEGQPKIDWVARKLELSRRSLQRLLDSEGCSFSKVLDGLLMDRAITLVRTSDVSLTDVALQLGYSDGAHFSRAFRRWTGSSPLKYRKSFRAN